MPGPDARHSVIPGDTGAVIDSLGGYRLLRSVGAGSRAEVFLAHPLGAEGDPTPVVIKLYGPSVSDDSIVAEIEALSRAEGQHVVRLVDVTSTPDGAPALVLTRHGAGSLTRLLGDRATLDPGEAITVLAPVATALARLHAAGVAHGGIGPGAVLFDTTGSPALACFGRATLFAPQLPIAKLEVEQAVLSDVLAFGALATTILERAGAESLAHRARTEAAPGQWLASFADDLFDLAEPLPIGLGPREAAHVGLPSRVIAPRAALPREEPSTPPLVSRVMLSLRAVRRPVWVVAAASALAVLVALVAVPRDPSQAAPRLSATPTAGPSAVDSGPVFGDDPVAAALVLLEAREGCIRDLSLECLEAVDQAGSSAMSADGSIVRSVLEGGEVPALPRGDSALLVQRLGDSALVSLGGETQPASLLLVKGEAGWRIRDYLEE